MAKKLIIVTFSILMVFVLAGCAPKATEAPAAQPEAPASGGAGLKVTGMVNSEMSWSLDQLQAMETMQADSTNKAGETTTYTGVLVTKLLELAGLKDGAATLAFIADDGYSAELTLAEIQACPNCIVGFRDDGKFQTVFPGFPGNTQVKGIIEINVK